LLEEAARNPFLMPNQRSGPCPARIADVVSFATNVLDAMPATTDNAIATSTTTIATPAVARPPRLESLDVFRGLTIAGMILVNDPGTWDAIYWPLAHADELMSDHATGWYPGKTWVDANGWTPTD